MSQPNGLLLLLLNYKFMFLPFIMPDNDKSDNIHSGSDQELKKVFDQELAEKVEDKNALKEKQITQQNNFDGNTKKDKKPQQENQKTEDSKKHGENSTDQKNANDRQTSTKGRHELDKTAETHPGKTQSKNFFDKLVEGELLVDNDSLINHVTHRLSHFYKDLNNRLKTHFKTTYFTQEETVGNFLIVRIFLKDILEKNIVVSYRNNCYKIQWSRDLQEVLSDDHPVLEEQMNKERRTKANKTGVDRDPHSQNKDEEFIPDESQAKPMTNLDEDVQEEKWSHHTGSISTTTHFPISNPMILNDDSCLTLVFERGKNYGKCTIRELREMGQIREWNEVYKKEKQRDRPE